MLILYFALIGQCRATLISDWLTVTDVDLCKLMAVKDADHFIDRLGVGVDYTECRHEVDRVFALMPSNMTGHAWRRMRAMSSPVFTSGKLKLMIPCITKVLCCDSFCSVL